MKKERFTMRTLIALLALLASTLSLVSVNAPHVEAAFVSVYRGGICVADGTGACIGGDIRAESGLGSQVGYMKTTADPGTVAVYRSTCYSDAQGSCTAWGLSLDVNGTPVGYLATSPPDSQSANAPLSQSNGLLLQNLGGTASAYLWSTNKQLVVTSVNGGTNPTAGTVFSVVVQAQDGSGNPINVSSATGASLSLKTGTGTLGGTLTGTIASGTNQATISGVTYTKAESGVVLTATRTSGDILNAGDSATFIVNPGIAAGLVFTTQPGNTTAGTSIAGPPTVSVRDNFGNTVTSSTASITVAIGTNPGGGTLSGITTRNASSGVAAFSGLNINQVGNGYTLTASTAGLTGATSSAFNIITGSSGLGIISGIVTRASNGTPISGAAVQVSQGTALIATATTTGAGSYSIGGLSDGTYSVRASSPGFVAQVRSGVTVASASTVTVDLSLNIGIAIHSPVAGAAINAFSVLVTGQFATSLGAEVGINVNGYVALQDADEFAAIVPVNTQTTSLTASVTSTSGTALASHTIPITAQSPTAEPVLLFRPSPAIALVLQPVSFTLRSLNPISQVQLDGNGDGTIDFTDSTLDAVTVTFAESGLYFPTVRVTESGGFVRTATAMVQIFDQTQLNGALQAKWTGLKNALRQGNISATLPYIITRRRSTYQSMFNSLTIPFANIDQILTNINFVRVRGIDVEYEMNVTKGGSLYSYMVLFSLDEDGVWRIKFF